MILHEINFALFGITLGAFFGALGIKLVIETDKTSWRYGFYGLGIISIILAVIEAIVNYYTIVSPIYVIPFLLILSGIFLLVFTKLFLDRKSIFKTSEVDPVINEFTKSADRTEIKLFGGDLNFFGNTAKDMDNNVQYTFLKGANFRKVSILCETPGDLLTRVRYGKILSELTGAELKFYNPDKADLKIRGRMKTFDGVDKLLIYRKVGNKSYQMIETDTANSNGALYGNIWDLIWSLAVELTNAQKQEYIGLR